MDPAILARGPMVSGVRVILLSNKTSKATIARFYLNFSAVKGCKEIIMEYVLTATKTEARAGSYYDKMLPFMSLLSNLTDTGDPSINTSQAIPCQFPGGPKFLMPAAAQAC